eukprot:7382207-Pyramimonas_sp.AAC.1
MRPGESGERCAGAISHYWVTALIVNGARVKWGNRRKEPGQSSTRGQNSRDYSGPSAELQNGAGM